VVKAKIITMVLHLSEVLSNKNGVGEWGAEEICEPELTWR
jgi:hypothetical protein